MFLQPAYLIVYLDESVSFNRLTLAQQVYALKWLGQDQANVRSYSLEGKAHFGEAKRIPLENIPGFLFQLVDQDYDIHPIDDDEKITGIKSFYAFSPEFKKTVREKEAQKESI